MHGGIPSTLSVRGLSKSYGALKAVSDMTFDIQPGEILGIGGPNGAGKTTLFDLISGVTPLTSGEVLWDGCDISKQSAVSICHSGISRTFQLNAAFESLSAFENLLCSAYFGPANIVLPGMVFGANCKNAVADLIDYVGLSPFVTTAAKDLPILQRKLLMIASALATKPRLLMLDEPVGGLNIDETDLILDLLRRIHRDTGMSMIVVEHVMRFLTALSTRVMVMDRGRKLYEGTAEGMAKDEAVVTVYLGQKAALSLSKNLQEKRDADSCH
jgi:branched-chain amino acid transport system ATP-binding protein